jgi:hypothetical protein
MGIIIASSLFGPRPGAWFNLVWCIGVGARRRRRKNRRRRKRKNKRKVVGGGLSHSLGKA